MTGRCDRRRKLTSPALILAGALACILGVWLLWWAGSQREGERRGESEVTRPARELLAAARREHGERSREAAEAMAALAVTLYKSGLGGSDEALELAEQALWIDASHDGAESDLALRRLNLVAVLLNQRGSFAAAEMRLERIAAVAAQRSPGSLRHATALLNLAEVERALEDFISVRRRLLSALAILREAGERDGGAPLGLAWNSLGLALHELGDLEEARESFLRSRQLLDALPDHRSSLASVLNNFGRALHDLRELEAARAAFEESIRILEEPGAGNAHFLASSRNNLGFLKHDRGDLEGARVAYTEALRLRRELYPAGHPNTAWTLTNLGLLAWDEGRLDEAARLLDEALALRRRTLGEAHRLTGHSLSYLAARRLAAGDGRASLAHAAAAETIRLRLLARVAPLLAERVAMRFVGLEVFGLEGSSLDLCLAAALQAAAGPASREASRTAWEALLRARGLVLEGVVATRRAAQSSGEEKLLALRAELDAVSRELAELWLRGGSPAGENAYESRLAELRRRQEAVESALAEASLSGRSGVEPPAVSVGDLAHALRALPAPAALVAYAEHERLAPGASGRRAFTASYVAFVLKGDGEPEMIDLGLARDIEGAVEVWSRAVLGGNVTGESAELAALSAYREAGEALRRRIWDPVAARLGGVARVFVVPDGVLHPVSFASLPVDGGRFLVESGPLLHLLSSERRLVEEVTSPRSPPGSGLLAVGAPDLSVPHATRWFARPFAPIPETEIEAREVARLVAAGTGAEDARLLIGRDATEESCRRLAPGRRILHLATHGFFLGAGPGADLPGTRAVEAIGDAEASATRGAIVNNPLLRSGLVLAAARDGATEDGILTAAEVGQLDLRGVEWAVLSACRSGEGAIARGEGVLGLRRAFEVAGARSLILSLWPVADLSTRRWMHHLYTARLTEGKDTATAVREASLRALEERRREGSTTHPFFWAAFVATGDWR